MSSKKKSETTSSVRLSPELREASLSALQGAEALRAQGTEGIFQGSQLAELDPLVRQAQEQQLALAGQDGALANQVAAQQQAFTGLLGAGDLDNSLFQRQVQDALEQANVSFQRGSVPLFQQAAAAGQFGGSEGQEGLGLLGGEINRNLQQAITQAALGGQQVALQAQGLAPQAIGLGLLPSSVIQDVGAQRTQRSQAELLDEIQQFEAPRRAEAQVQAEFQNFLASNPLVSESTTKNVQKTSGSALQSALGVGATVAGFALPGGGTVGGSLFSKAFPSLLGSGQ